MGESCRFPFFSVVMPVYNSEKYLKRAVDSVLEQTFSDLELILVDDCSSDSSPEIISDYKKKDSRVITVKTRQNAGVSNARNVGIRQVQGRYLTFVDSDDYIETELFAKVKNIIDHTGVQLVKYSMIEQYYNKNGKSIGNNVVTMPDEIFSTSEEVRKKILRSSLFGYLSNSFYDLKTVPKYLWNFDTRWRVNEDFRMDIKLIGYISKMACMSYVGYHYEKRESSSLSSKQNDRYYEETKIKPELFLQKYKEWGLLTKDYRQEIYWKYIRIVYSTVCRTLKQEGWDGAQKALQRIYNDDLFESFIIENRNVKYPGKKRQIMYRALWQQKTSKVLFLCKAINFVQKHFQILFARVKE